MSPILLAASAPAVSIAFVAAQDAIPGFNAGTLGQYGVLGIVNFILFRFAQQAYNREKDRADKSDTEVARLNAKIQEEYTDVLQKSSEALTESSKTLHDLADKLARRRA